MVIFNLTTFYKVSKSPIVMLIIGLFSIAISSWLTYSINTLENTKLPIFDGLKIAGYVVTISLAAIGANIAAGAIMFRAKKTVERKRCEAKKELEEISNMINDINNKISEASSDNDKFSYINKKIELEERAQKLKGLLDDC
jgi:preprotein translocase subunit Sec63